MPKIEIGTGATALLYSDRHAYTVIGISKSGKTLTLQRDNAELSKDFRPEHISGGFNGHCVNQHEQTYTYTRNPAGNIITVRQKRIKRPFSEQSSLLWYHGKLKFIIGERREFYDYNF